VSESKANGTKEDIFIYTAQHSRGTGSVIDWAEDYFKFLGHIPKICESKVVFENFPQMVERLTVQLVGNYFISADVKPQAVETVQKRIEAVVPVGRNIDVQLETTLDVFCRIIRNQKANEQGRRYGHPVIDLARELNRYLNPRIHGVEKSQTDQQTIRDALVNELRAIIGCQ
jgi:hypothetical protein